MVIKSIRIGWLVCGLIGMVFEGLALIPVTSKGSELDVREETLVLQKRIGIQLKDPLESGLTAFTLPPDGDVSVQGFLRNARLALKHGNIDRAELLYLKLLEQDMPITERLDLLVEYGNMYVKTGKKVKYSAVLENFVALGAGDPRLPIAYLELGRAYRELGDFKKSLLAFNNVLNASLMGAEVDMEAFKRASLKAKIEITDTYLSMGDFDEANRALKRLQTLSLSDADREKILFQSITLQFNQGHFQGLLSDIKKFIELYPKSDRLCEVRFLLATVYRKQGQFDASLKEVLGLLQDQSLAQNISPDVLLYWRGKAGNQIANAFYEQGDYTNALTIYQAMLSLHVGPIWQWPVLYQMGLCYERLNMHNKAKDMYTQVVSGENVVGGVLASVLTPSLIATQESAKWRLKQMEWFLDMEKSLSEPRLL